MSNNDSDKVNKLALRLYHRLMSAYALRGKIKETKRGNLIGWAWGEMYERGIDPEVGVSSEITLLDGTRIRIQVDVLPPVPVTCLVEG